MLILFFLAIFFAFYIISNQIARLTNSKPLISIFTIVSPSMEPNINVYDVIINTKVSSEDDLDIGDIITFYSDAIVDIIFIKIFKPITNRIEQITTFNNDFFILNFTK